MVRCPGVLVQTLLCGATVLLGPAREAQGIREWYPEGIWSRPCPGRREGEELHNVSAFYPVCLEIRREGPIPKCKQLLSLSDGIISDSCCLFLLMFQFSKCSTVNIHYF